ncbi:MAG: DUF1080 domain-containing protein [Phycisphaera sp.]|nr:MAG: DUF1080 domain-containing protein [Phycisphaera sp.]
MLVYHLFVAVSALALQPDNAPLPDDRSRGATLRVYQVADTLARVPDLVEGQTPNHDRVVSTLDIRGPGAFGGVPAPIVTTLSAGLRIDTAGAYRFRLTSDDGALMYVNGSLVADNDGRHGMIAVESTPVDLDRGEHGLLIRHFDHAGERGILVEWMPPGSQEWAMIPGALLTTDRDPTRVVSPGVKRIIGGGRPGDGMPLDDVHPAWRVDSLRPEGFEPMVGAMCFDHRGRLIVGTFFPLQRDEVSLPDIDAKQPDTLVALRGVTLRENPTGDPAKVSVEIVAEGLYEPSGLCAIGEDIYVAHRRAITRLSDADGDGFYETHETVGQGWEGWNYHQFVFDLEHIDRDGDGPHPGHLYSALSTAMAPPDWAGMGTNAAPNGPMRGGIIEVDLSSNDARVIAGGTRTPNGMGLGPAVGGEPTLFYADNQGTWMPTSQFSEVIAGRFYGHFNRTNKVPNLADRFPDGGYPSVFADRDRTSPALFLPQNEVNNSPTESMLIDEGPFAGQMLLGELTAGGLRRIFLERVNGHWQGALFRHTQGLEVGVNRITRGPDGEIFIGGIGGGGNWNWRDTRFGFQRLTPTGDTVFEFESVRATPDGFELRFTRDIDSNWLEDPANYALSQWGYEPTAEYGGVKRRIEKLHVAEARVVSRTGSGSAVRIRVPGLERGSCVHIRCDAESVAGEQMWSPEAWYTLIEVPRPEPLTPASASITRDIERTGVGVGVLPPRDATPLIARHTMPAWSSPGESRGGNIGTRTQIDLLNGSEHIEMTAGDVETVTSFGDARLHLEWLAPPGGAGQLAGNSGVYLQGLYELQILGTKAGERDLAANEAGAIYNVKPADRNASTGPGTWQAYDIWFTAARFENGKKTSDARVTVLWNGELIHDDIAVTAPTGSRNRPGAETNRLTTLPNGETIRIGPLLLQHHASTADGPVRFRNVWIRSIEPREYSAKAGADRRVPIETLEGVPIVGGDAAFRIERTDDGSEIVGTTRPNTPNTFLVLEQSLEDFELLAEVRQDPRLNSGIQIRSTVDGGVSNRRGRLCGPQVELDPSERSYSGGIYGEGLDAGWIYPLTDAPHARRAYRSGEWNRVRVLAEGPRVRTWINGIPAADIYDEGFRSGHIALQVHGVGGMSEPLEVQWRNIRLRLLQPE